jgi:hypothetical protein
VELDLDFDAECMLDIMFSLLERDDGDISVVEAEAEAEAELGGPVLSTAAVPVDGASAIDSLLLMCAHDPPTILISFPLLPILRQSHSPAIQ